jgi:RNA polymerase sigma-70 factor (ECF subfamily)
MGQSNESRRSTREADFAAFLKGEQATLYGYIHSLVCDLNDADDLFQQVAMILWRKFDEFDRQRSFVAWACGVARLEVANFLRTRSRSKLYFSDEINSLLIDAQQRIRDEQDARREALGKCVEKLRQRDRDLLERCYAEPSGVNDAAHEAGRAPQSVHNSLRRIRRALFLCIRRTIDQEVHPQVLS